MIMSTRPRVKNECPKLLREHTERRLGRKKKPDYNASHTLGRKTHEKVKMAGSVGETVFVVALPVHPVT
jgi:hypothetical protein